MGVAEPTMLVKGYRERRVACADLQYRAGCVVAICYEFDLSKPIWLDSTINEFKRHAKARFYQDNFVDEIDFDYLEIQIIEE